MELPRRDRNDELLRAGEMNDLRSRLRRMARGQDLATVIACAFDHRTRMLPFIFADMRMVPAGVRAIGSAMVDIGCHKTRIVLQQWNKRFRPSQMRLDGRVPDLIPTVLDIDPFHGCKSVRRAGAVRSAMQGHRASDATNTADRFAPPCGPGAFCRWRRRSLLEVSRTTAQLAPCQRQKSPR